MKLKYASLLLPAILFLIPFSDALPVNGTSEISGDISDSSKAEIGAVLMNGRDRYDKILLGFQTDATDISTGRKTTSADKAVFPAAGNIVYVGPGGVCGGKSPCYSSIQAGIDAAGGSGKIMVARGTYHENVVVNTSKEFSLEAGWDSTFTTKSEDPSLTVIDGDTTGDGKGDGSVITLDAAEGIFISVTIENFTITNGFMLDAMQDILPRFGSGINAVSAGADNLQLTILNDVISKNRAFRFGGGLYNERGTATIINCVFNNNSAGWNGGGITNNGGSVTIIKSTVSDNGANTGGGVSNGEFGGYGGDTMTIDDSNISFNGADFGGGIGVLSGTVTVTNTTIHNNGRSVEAGAIFVYGESTLTIAGSTVSGNHNGGIKNHPQYSGTVTLQNTILAGNIGDDFVDCSGTITSLGNNIIGDPFGCTITLLPTDRTGGPGLGSYIDNGIPGNGHLEVLPASPAIDAGNSSACSFTDQLGQLRIDGDLDGTVVCDIGAIEFHDPISTIAINAGNAYTTSSAVMINLSCIDASKNSCAMMQFSNDGINWFAPEPFALVKTWTLSDGDGIKMVAVKFKDNDGNWSSVVTDKIILDATPPSKPPEFTATAVSASEVILSWAHSMDAVGVVGYSIYRNNSFVGTTAAGEIAYSDKGLTPSTNYTYSIYAYDIGGNVSEGASDLTTTQSAASKRYTILGIWPPPTIDGDCSEYQNALSIQITNGKETGTYRFLWTADPATDEALYGCATVTDGKLNADIATRDGELYMDDSMELFFDTLRDRGSMQNGNDYKFIVNILNTQFDANYGLSGINWNASWTSTVHYSGTINNNGDIDSGYTIEFRLPWSDWGIRPAANTVWGFDLSLNSKDDTGTNQTAWANTTGGGFNDPDGWGEMVFSHLYATSVDPAVDDITPPVGTIVINSGNADTNSRSVTLALSATDPSGVSSMCVSNTTACASTNWEPYKTTKSWTLSEGDGVKTVYVWFSDKANYQHNSNPIPYSDSIVLTLPTYRLQVTKDGSPADLVERNPAGIFCGAVCFADFKEGTPVMLTARPSPSQMYFKGWTGSCVGNALVCQLTINEDKEVTATFDTIADFEASPPIGPAPLFVGFSDTSFNSPSSWLWNFGDGSSSSLQNPEHIFASAGNYEVTLVATGSGISPQKTKVITVGVCNEGPVRIAGSDLSRIQDACDMASDDEDVLIQARSFPEDLIITNDAAVTLRGGYDCGFSWVQGFTAVQGSLTIIGQGSVSIENLMIR